MADCQPFGSAFIKNKMGDKIILCEMKKLVKVDEKIL